MIAGIIWKVEALPTPEAKNRNMKLAKKPMKAPGWSLMPMKWMTPYTPAAMAMNTSRLTRPPPHLSDTHPVMERDSAPTSGPRKTSCSASTSGNWVRAGALFGLDRDYDDIGRQAAEMALAILGGTDAKQVPPAAPRKVCPVFNLKTARQMGIEFQEDVLRGACEVVR